MPKRLKLIEDAPSKPKEPELPDGNPAKILDFKLIRDYCKLIQRGMPMDGAADYYLIGQATIATWLRKGKTYLLGDGQPSEDKIYGIFVQALGRAMAEYRKLRLKYLHDHYADPKNRMIEFRILERRDRKNFGKLDPMGGIEDIMEPDNSFL